jgi:hypothetical protein
MSQPNEEQPSGRRKRAERSLSGLVTNIEFTLISVMAGVVLAPLADGAKSLVRDLRFETWPYILFGLLYILFMWSGVISHSFTFVGWPFELGHNLFYIVWALVLALQAGFLADPLGWFAMNMIQFMVAGWIGVYDQRILEKRAVETRGAARELFKLAGIRQARLIRMFPLAAGSSLLSLVLILLFPTIFIDLHLHWLLGGFQILVAGAGLLHNARSLSAWQEPIVLKAMEELEEED